MALTTDDDARWQAWQEENRRQFLRSDRMMRVVAVVAILVSVVAVVVAVVQR